MLFSHPEHKTCLKHDIPHFPLCHYLRRRVFSLFQTLSPRVFDKTNSLQAGILACFAWCHGLPTDYFVHSDHAFVAAPASHCCSEAYSSGSARDSHPIPFSSPGLRHLKKPSPRDTRNSAAKLPQFSQFHNTFNLINNHPLIPPPQNHHPPSQKLIIARLTAQRHLNKHR